MGALDRFKNKAEELRDKAKPMAGTLKDKAERATETIKAKANEFNDARPPATPGQTPTNPTTPDAATETPEGGPAQPGV
jgi:hypothetical protein